MVEFAVSRPARLIALVLIMLLVLAYCHPAPSHAGAHGSGYPGTRYEAYTYPKDFPLDTPRDEYATNSATAGTPKFSLTFVDRQPEHYADIVFHNELTRAYYVHRQVNFVRPDGLVVTVYFDMGNGDEPDLFTVIAPPGYVAIPVEMYVEEGETGTIEIHEATLG